MKIIQENSEQSKNSINNEKSASDQQERHAKIELAAYHVAYARGFSDGNALDDWLTAEKSVDNS